MEDREEGRVLQEKVLRFAEERQPLPRIDLVLGPGEELLVPGGFPAGRIGAAVRRENLQERVRIVVLPEVALPGDVVLAPADHSHEDGKFQVAQLDGDPQIDAPHLLDGGGDLLVVLVGVVEHLKAGEALAAGEPRLGQQPASLE